MAVRLRQALEDIGFGEKDLRAVAKCSLGVGSSGQQHFLHSESTSPVMQRTRSHNNTASAKCIFFPHNVIGEEIIRKFESGNYLMRLLHVKGFQNGIIQFCK